MEGQAKHNMVYHWTDHEGQTRIYHADDANDMAELTAYIEQCMKHPTGHPVYVHEAVEGSLVKDANESEFMCAMCRNTYIKGQTDEEAMEETNSHWPGTSIEECGVVCDDCWQRMKPDQQDAVHIAYDFIAGMNKLQSMAGHAQDEFEIITKKLLDIGRITSDDIGELRDRQ